MESMTNELKTTNNNSEVARKPYTTPTLRSLGEVQSVVLAGAHTGNDSNQSISSSPPIFDWYGECGQSGPAS